MDRCSVCDSAAQISGDQPEAPGWAVMFENCCKRLGKRGTPQAHYARALVHLLTDLMPERLSSLLSPSPAEKAEKLFYYLARKYPDPGARIRLQFDLSPDDSENGSLFDLLGVSWALKR